MTFNEYQEFADSTAVYPDRGFCLHYPAMKLAGEAGEVNEKIGKLWRDDGITNGHAVPAHKRLAILKELGDNLWYIAALAKELDSTIDEVAVLNVQKLTDRVERGVINGSGDNR